MSAAVTATFVFTDLVDSTAIAARLGPQGAEALRQSHFGALRTALAASTGTEVKNLGDGLMAVYSSASRALAGAVAMQQAIEHLNRSADETLAIRVGMSVGEATEEDGDYFGEPVVEAARLCAAATGGQILATEMVQLLVGRHVAQSFAPVGPLQLKGLPDPVNAVEVLWSPAGASLPLPGRLAGAATDALFGFFGRVAEREAIENAMKHARSTDRVQALFVAGEAGIGKTSLVAQVARAAHADGWTVLFGHSDEDLGVGYQPWIEALSCLVQGDDAAALEELPSAQRAALTRLLPSLGIDAPPAGDADSERMLLLEAVRQVLAGASNNAPVLVVLDDLHWVDAASLQLLRHVLTCMTPMRVTIITTYRDSDLGRGDPLTRLLADMHREANVTRVSLRGLDDTDIAELLAAAAGHELDDDGFGLAHALRRETEGNPFFTTEVLRHLGETGRIVQNEAGRWVVEGGLEDLGLPSSVREVVGRRVERLGEEAVRLLSAAAVIGRDFDLDLLAAITETDADALLDIMDAAIAGAVIIEHQDGYRFSHALIQHTLYDDMTAPRRQRAHLRIAQALEARPNSGDPTRVAELAHHWTAATRAVDTDKAIDYSRLAGDAARAAFAPDDAIRWYAQALELLDRQAAPDQRTRTGLLIALGTAQSAATRSEYKATLLQAFDMAEQLDDGELLVAAALGFLSPSSGQLVGDEVANRVVTKVLQLVPETPMATRARLLAALSETYDAAMHWQERNAAAFEAIDAARGAGDPRAFLDVINHTWSVLETPDRRESTIADFDRALAIADEIGDPLVRTQIRRRAMWARYSCADIEGADQLIDEIRAITETVGLAQGRYEAALSASGRMLLAGNSDAAEVLNEAVLEFGTAAGVPEVLGVYGGIMHAIAQHRGRTEEIVGFFLEVARDNPSIAALRSTLPSMLSDLGRLEEANERLEQEAAGGYDYPYDSLWLVSMMNLADAAATTANTRVAAAMIQRLEPFADHVVCPSGDFVLGANARPLARAATALGRHEQAEQWFALAHDVHERLQAPFWIARGRLDHADLCLARRADGDLDRARELATTAAQLAAEYGCNGLTERAALLLAAL